MSQVIYNQSNPSTKNKNNELDRLVKASKKVLYKCRSVFPFTFFPDTVVVDQNKIDIVYSTFFFSKSIFTLMIDDVRTVKVNIGPFFATMLFEVIGYEKNPQPVRFLPKKSALKMRRIIMGLTTAKRERIELESLNRKLLVQKAEEIGTTQEKIIGV